jgi:phosphatidylglycerophosphate synthase
VGNKVLPGWNSSSNVISLLFQVVFWPFFVVMLYFGRELFVAWVVY